MMLVKSCFETWQEVVLMQRKTKETFEKLLLELKWFNDMIYEISSKKELCEKLDLTKKQFDPYNWNEVKDDEDQLYEYLRKSQQFFFDLLKDYKPIKYIIQ